jgi:hypothetical protein
MPTSRRRPPFAAADEDRSGPVVEIVLGKRERLLDAQPGSEAVRMAPRSYPT